MCGILGIHANTEITSDLRVGLMMLQHRGQDSFGFSTLENASRLHTVKKAGLVLSEVDPLAFSNLKGNTGLAHVRYKTAGKVDNILEFHPITCPHPYGIHMVHNGNINNVEKLKDLLKQARIYVATESDSEMLLNVFATLWSNRLKNGEDAQQSLFDAVDDMHELVRGSYSMILLIAGIGLVAIRDPNGIRPLVMGERATGEYMFASESVALDPLGFKITRDVAPGETILIGTDGKLSSRQFKNIKFRPCLFEYFYFSRPDSIVNGVPVHLARENMGHALAKRIKSLNLPIDIVIPVPDTSRTSATSIAEDLGVPLREGFIKNRYLGRTFIMPENLDRVSTLQMKLNIIPEIFKDKNVLIVDDSIVRGTTSQKIVELVRRAEPKAVYMASMAPPVKFANIYGININTSEELIANNRTIDEIQSYLGLDKLIYQDLDDLKASIRLLNPSIEDFDTSIFDGKYITKEDR